MKQVRYVLTEVATGEPAQKYNQDDSTQNVEAPSLSRLIDEIADWEDVMNEDILENLSPDGVLTLGSGEFKIIREEFEELALTDGDIAELDRLCEAEGVVRGDTRREVMRNEDGSRSIFDDVDE